MTRPEPIPRTLFLHQPKTAGTTVRMLFGRNVPRDLILEPVFDRGEAERSYIRFVNGDGPGPAGPGRPNARWAAVIGAMPPEHRARLRLVQGHFWFGLHDLLPGSWTYVTVLRDPVERIVSLHHHRTTQHGLRVGLAEYIRTARDFEVDNGQVRWVAGGRGANLREPADEDLLAVAERNLSERFLLAGLTERFDESVAVLAATFGWRKLAYGRHNVSEGRPPSERLDPAIVEAIRDRNRFDIELRRLAGELLDRRMRELGPSFERALRRLRRQMAVQRRTPAPVLRAYRRSKAVGASARRVVLGRGSDGAA